MWYVLSDFCTGKLKLVLHYRIGIRRNDVWRIVVKVKIYLRYAVQC